MPKVTIGWKERHSKSGTLPRPLPEGKGELKSNIYKKTAYYRHLSISPLPRKKEDLKVTKYGLKWVHPLHL